MTAEKDTWEGHVYKLPNGRFHAVVSYNDLYGFEYPPERAGSGYDSATEAADAARGYATLLQEIGQDDRSEGNMVAKDRMPKGAFVDFPPPNTGPKAALKAVAIRGAGKKKTGPKPAKRQGPKGP